MRGRFSTPASGGRQVMGWVLAGLVGDGVGDDLGGLVEGEPRLPQSEVGARVDETGDYFAEGLVRDAGQSLGVQPCRARPKSALALRARGCR